MSKFEEALIGHLSEKLSVPIDFIECALRDFRLKSTGFRMSKAQQNSYNLLVKVAKTNGCKVVSPFFTDRFEKMLYTCPEGHLKCVTGRSFRAHPKACYTCSTIEPVKLVFEEAIAKIGWVVIGTYVNSTTPIDCMCVSNHICSVYPVNITKKRIICHE